MTEPSTILQLGVFAVVAAVATACTVETSSGGGYAYGGEISEVDAAAGGDSGIGGSPSPSPDPILARVDPNVKMNSSPGQGVGVFTEYDFTEQDTAGHWHVWWTCDTSITNETCPFHITISVNAGSIENATSEQFASTDSLTKPGETGALEATTVTTVGVQGVLFDTDPGATITLTATVSGLYNGKFLFWVQGGRINDGYPGAVTDPLMLIGSSP
jgi:hypothetical protein